jgi:hypothetical protein
MRRGVHNSSLDEHGSSAELRDACTRDSDGGNSGRYQVSCMAQAMAAEARHAGAGARAGRIREMAIRNQCCGDSVVRDDEGNIPMGAPSITFRHGRALRIQDPKLMHITVAPCISALGYVVQPLIVIPLLKSCMREFQALHQGRCFVSTATRG